jgi:hypothetical protein
MISADRQYIIHISHVYSSHGGGVEGKGGRDDVEDLSDLNLQSLLCVRIDCYHHSSEIRRSVAAAKLVVLVILVVQIVLLVQVLVLVVLVVLVALVVLVVLVLLVVLILILIQSSMILEDVPSNMIILNNLMPTLAPHSSPQPASISRIDTR